MSGADLEEADRLVAEQDDEDGRRGGTEQPGQSPTGDAAGADPHLRADWGADPTRAEHKLPAALESEQGGRPP